MDRNKEASNIDQYVNHLRARVEQLEKAIKKHRMVLWGIGEDQRGELYQVDESVDDGADAELYKVLKD